MKVSVVMPVYNASKHLPETLASLERQTYDQWQLIAVDDCSDDSSLSLLQQFRQRHPGAVEVLSSGKPRSGAAVCRNIGWKHAAGDYIIFLDADDVLEPFCLATRIAVMTGNAAGDLGVFNQYAWYPGKKTLHNLYNQQVSSREEAIKYFLEMKPAWQTMAVIWKRSAIEKLSGFDESLYFMEDPELHLRALLDTRLNVRFEFGHPADCFYRMPGLTEANAETFYINSIKSRFLFLEKITTKLSNTVAPQLLVTYRKYLRDGFFDFIKVFVAARMNHFKEQFESTVAMLKSRNILSSADALKLRVFKWMYASESGIVKALHLRGLAFRLL